MSKIKKNTVVCIKVDDSYFANWNVSVDSFINKKVALAKELISKVDLSTLPK